MQQLLGIVGVLGLFAVIFTFAIGRRPTWNVDRAMFRVRRRGGVETVTTWATMAGVVLLVLGLPDLGIPLASSAAVVTLLVTLCAGLVVAPRITGLLVSALGFGGAMLALVELHGVEAGLSAVAVILLLTWIVGLFRGYTRA